MRFKVAVCDDEEVHVKYLEALAEEWAKKNDYAADILTFPSAEAFLFVYSEQKDFDILLLDIEMNGMNGVELAKRIRENNEAVQIIFITGFADYISLGYEVSALHYLLKPVGKEKLFEVFDRAAKNLSKKEGRLTVRFDRQTEYIPYGKILYIEAQLQYVVIYMPEGSVRMKASLSEIEKELDDGFIRCQRSFIINLSHVGKIKNDCVLLKNGISVPISRGMSEKIGKAIIRHF